MKLTRRRLLRGAGGACLALPFLEANAPRIAAAAPSSPRRLIVVVHRHGTLPHYWTPVGSDSGNLNISPLMDPLIPWRFRIGVVAGIDNRIPYHYRHTNLHAVAESTLLTAALPGDELVYGKFYSTGPSIDQAVAERISGGTPFPTLNLAVGSDEGAAVTNTHLLFSSDGSPVSSIADPALAFQKYLAGGGQRDGQWRGSVLDLAGESLSSLRSRLGAEDQQRLDAHAERIWELEQRAEAATCSASEPSLGNAYDFRREDDLSAPAQIGVLATAMACGLANVGTLVFDNLEEASFAWLTEDGSPLADREKYRSWTDMIHYGGEVGEELLFPGFQWYSQQFRLLLETLDGLDAPEGGNLLESTLVLWISEFGDGWSHSLESLPVVLAGAARCATGSFRDLRADEGVNPYTTNCLYTSVLQAFGESDDSFGYQDSLLPTGGIPDLV